MGRSSNVRAGAQPTLLGVLNGVGNLFALSLSCTLACCLVVTAYPALASQQRALRRWLADSDTAAASLFWRHFCVSLRPLLLPGVGFLVALGVCIGSALLWAASPLPWRWLGLSVALPVAGLLVTYGAGAVVLAGADPDPAPPAPRSVLSLLASSSPRSGATLIGLLAWVLFVGMLPLLCLPVLTVVPALIAHWGLGAAAPTADTPLDADR